MIRELIEKLKTPKRFIPYDDLSLRTHLAIWHQNLYIARTMWDQSLTNWDHSDSNPYTIHWKDHDTPKGTGGDPRHRHG